MRKINVITIFAIIVAGAAMAYGQASRTWVSGVGDDANPCSRTAPCKTFAGAISKTAAGGEIDALDPAGFGALTITKAITIDGGGGQVASVLVAGTNGIVVQAGANDVVILRNLRINGISGSGNGGINGIRFLSGKDLNIENCYIFGFTQNGIDIALNQATQASVHVLNSVTKQTAVGVRATNAQTPAVAVSIADSAMILNTIGVESALHSHVVVQRSVMENGSTAGVAADAADAILHVEHSDIAFNGSGALAQNTGAIISADNKFVFNNLTAISPQTQGTIFTFGNNRIHNNGATGSFSAPALPQQ
jgi:hypothetical protein